MPCYKPMTAWYAKEINNSGKRSLVFNPKKAYQPDDPIEIACGQCIGCKLERSRQWAIRCVNEASLYEDNCFLTLTFSPEYLKKRKNPWSLDVRDYQLFMKRLRKKYGKNIRFFHCGEYGEKNRRPHYHAIIFNFDFPDKKLWKIVNENRLYISDDLSSLWPFGFSTIGDVTFESAAYVARYITKKVTGEAAKDHYIWCDEETGEAHPLKPEYTTMSRRPGIGKEWFDKYRNDVYPSDFITMNGKKIRPPKYYDKIMEATRPYEFEEIKEKRIENAKKHYENNTYERLAIREKCQLLKMEKLPRNLNEDET
jgi:hypothetical protein